MSESTSPAVHARAAVARAVLQKNPDAEREARRALATEKIAEYIQRVLAQAPPLTDEQCTRLAELVRAVRPVSGGMR